MGTFSWSSDRILSLIDCFRYSGDAAALEQYLTNAQVKLEHANTIFTNPPITFYGHDERLGACFEEPDRPETKRAYRLLFVRTCREFAWALRQSGRTAMASACEQMADRRAAEIRAEPDWLEHLGLHAAAEAIDAGVTVAAEQDWLYQREFSDRLNRLSYSPFNQYFVIRGMARMNRFDEALTTVRDQWGGQIQYGGTTFFEVYRPSWNEALGPNDAVPNCQVGYTSLAHPWGGGVTKWLSEEILGIKPIGPGFSLVEIAPHLGSRLTWVEGTVPTPLGPVSARVDVEKGLACVKIPPGSTARIGIPKAGRTVQSLKMDGRVIWDGKLHAAGGISGGAEDRDFVWLEGFRHGDFSFSIQYDGSRPTLQESPFVYPARFLQQDRQTGGNWGGSYGQDGFMLFSYDGLGQDRGRLPDYIAALTCRRGNGRLWETNTPDSRVLSPNAANTFPRCAAALLTGDPAPCQQSIVLDVGLKARREFQFALYFLDFDRRGRRVAVELFDMDSRKLIAPVKVFPELGGGTYAVYACQQSVRIRVNQVRGDNASLSGIFFDPMNRSQRQTQRETVPAMAKQTIEPPYESPMREDPKLLIRLPEENQY